MHAERKTFGLVGHENNPDPRTFKAPTEKKDASGSSVSFDDYCVANTGKYINGEKYAKSYFASDDLARQSIEIAERLQTFIERDGGTPLLKPSDKVLITHVTRQIIEVPEFSNNNFLPYQAAKNRNQMSKGLEYYIENEAPTDRNGRHYFHYMVATFGKRVRLNKAAKRAKRSKETVARFMEEAKRKFGTEFIFIGWEYTIDKKKTLHWHANIVYQNPFFLDGGEAFYAFLKEWEAKYGQKSEDCGRLENTREVCKYPFKPADLNRLDDEELYELFKFSYRRRYFEMLGSAKKMRAKHLKEGLRYGMMNDRVVTRQTSCLFERANDGSTEANEGEQETRADPVNILLCSVAPSFAFGMWSEGAVLVWNYNPRTVSQEGQLRLDYMQHIAQPFRDEWKRKQCPDPRTAVVASQAARERWLRELAEDDSVIDDAEVHALWQGDFRNRRLYGVHNGTISPESPSGFGTSPPNDEIPEVGEGGFLSIFGTE